MQYSLAVLALAAAAAASPFPQGVTEEIAPEASAPAGCQVSCQCPLFAKLAFEDRQLTFLQTLASFRSPLSMPQLPPRSR